MHIDWLQIENLRNLTHTRIQPSHNLNIFTGPNASGKTAFLEAIYLLSRAKSFRSPRINEVIQHNKRSFLVTAGIRYAGKGTINTGIERDKTKTVIHYNGQATKKISEQAKNIPLVLVAPDTHSLILGAPKQRRHWLDWAMFHVEPAYLDDWRDYHKALRHRNNLLKKGIHSAQALAGWENIMVETALRITDKRQGILDKIEEYVISPGQDFFEFPLKIKLLNGWPENQNLSDCLLNNREPDRQRGHTKYGIHRADIEFYAGEHLLSSVCSRGQAKLFIIILLVAQAKVMEEISGERSLYLFDDYTAEIDSETRIKIIDLILEQGVQAFFTTTEADLNISANSGVKMFHVERGNVLKVVE